MEGEEGAGSSGNGPPKELLFIPKPPRLLSPSLKNEHEIKKEKLRPVKPLSFDELPRKLMLYLLQHKDKEEVVRAILLQESRNPLEICYQLRCLFESLPQKILANKKHIVQFFCDLELHMAEEDSDKKDFMTLLGQLFYFANEDLPWLGKILAQQEDVIQVAKTIDQKFGIVVSKVKNKLRDLWVRQEKTKLQPADMALQTAFPFVLAKFLITNYGTVNFMLIPHLQEVFLNSDSNLKGCETHFSRILSCLWDTPELCVALSNLKPPRMARGPINMILKLSLSMSRFAPLTNFSSQQMVLATALSALTSHLRQGESGNCFAASLAIGLLSSQLKLCVKDFSDLIFHGKLSRTVGKVKIDFPFLLKPDYSSYAQKITLNAKGAILEAQKKGRKLSQQFFQPKKETNIESSLLWRDPGIERICHALALIPEVDVKQVIEDWFVDKSTTKEVTIEELIEGLIVRYQKKYPGENEEINALKERLALAYESQTRNLLLKAWESSLASMAEGGEGGEIRRSISEAIYSALAGFCRRLKLGGVEHYLKELYKTIFERIWLQYDFSMGLEKSGDQLLQGAFVLHDQMTKKRYDNPKTFAVFIYDIVEKSEFKNVKIRELLLKYIETRDFIVDVIQHHHRESLIDGDPMRDYKKMQYTPWVMYCGNRSKAAMKVYFGKEKKWEEMMPKDSVDLLTNILLFRKKTFDENGELALKFIPVSTIGMHAFSLSLLHPSLPPMTLVEAELTQWIEKRLITVGIEVAGQIMTKDGLEKFIEFIKSGIVPERSRELFIDYVKQQTKEMTVYEWREIIRKFLSKEIVFNATSKRQWLRGIDMALFKALPKQDQKRIEQSAICFADTNWQHEGRSIYFCFACNPGSRYVELWECYEDGTHLELLDQSVWINGSTWEIYQPRG
jgi:hypothetical protein